MGSLHDYSSLSNPPMPTVVPQNVDPSLVDFREFYPYIPNEIKHRKRTTQAQLEILERTFSHDKKPNSVMRASLARQLDMTPRGVQVNSRIMAASPDSDVIFAANSQVWFQNRCALASYPPFIPLDRHSHFSPGGRKKRRWPKRLPPNFTNPNRHLPTLQIPKRPRA